jgi:sugar lactone lactonase YvrE
MAHALLNLTMLKLSCSTISRAARFLGAGSGIILGALAHADVLVGNTQAHNVVRFDTTTGAYLGELIAPGVGGLQSPDDLTLGPDGLLYITSGSNDATPGQGVLRFDPKTGAFIDHFTKFGASGKDFIRPYGCAFGPDGHLYVASFRTDEIMRFDGQTGAFIDVFARGEGVADSLNGPNDLLFTPAGKLLVTTQGCVAKRDGTGQIAYKFPSQILEYDLTTKAARVFATPGPLDGKGSFSSLLGLTAASDGESFFVTDFANGLLRYRFTGELKHVVSTRVNANQVGNVALLAHRLYIPIFESKTLEGSLLRYDENLLPSADVKAVTWINDAQHLQRPVGIVALP